MYRPNFNIDSIPLANITDLDWQLAARDIGRAAKRDCSVNSLKAVAAVESAGSGYLPTGECKILFEPHIFWQRLILHGYDPVIVLRQSPQYQSVLYKKWKEKPYGKSSEQWDRLRLAATLNINAAYESASFGKFQIMGYHYDVCGYKDIFTFAHHANLGEKYHLQWFVNYIISERLALALASNDFKFFAMKYNGTGYHNYTVTKVDDYDYKMSAVKQKLDAANKSKDVG